MGDCGVCGEVYVEGGCFAGEDEVFVMTGEGEFVLLGCGLERIESKVMSDEREERRGKDVRRDDGI